MPQSNQKPCTFSTSQAEQRRVKQVEKQAKLSQRYLKRAMAWLAERGSEGVDLETLRGPPSPLPRALIDANGLPYKGTKSTSTTYLQRRYKHPPRYCNPWRRVPDSDITHLDHELYARLYKAPAFPVRPHFIGVKSVHVLFDVPGAQHETPKEIE